MVDPAGGTMPKMLRALGGIGFAPLVSPVVKATFTDSLTPVDTVTQPVKGPFSPAPPAAIVPKSVAAIVWVQVPAEPQVTLPPVPTVACTPCPWFAVAACPACEVESHNASAAARNMDTHAKRRARLKVLVILMSPCTRASPPGLNVSVPY
jgi:hypothetical protein